MTDLIARPIIFSAPMIRALLDEQKTQTRRVLSKSLQETATFLAGDEGATNDLDLWWDASHEDDGKVVPARGLMACADYPEEGVIPVGSGYGNIGDLLWVRETFCTDVIRAPDLPQIIYAADYCGERSHIRWRPSIHMPRWASRLTLRLTEVRIERLQEISEEDARAEGITGPHYVGYPAYFLPGDSKPRYSCATAAFECLWESLHGPDSWSANPWVWALTFDVIRKNVDKVVDDD